MIPRIPRHNWDRRLLRALLESESIFAACQPRTFFSSLSATGARRSAQTRIKSLPSGTRCSGGSHRHLSTYAPSAQQPPQQSRKRTHMCGHVDVSHVGQRVVLCGWALSARKAGKDLVFVPLRDATGISQLVYEDPHSSSSHSAEARESIRDALLSITPESVVRVSGIVRKRPTEAVKKDQCGGEVEIVLEGFEVLNAADPLPFSTAARAKLPSEEVRLKYRYVDLRRSQLQDNLRKRALAAHTARNYLQVQRFVEVETPLLFKSTPEGAREFLVPTRHPGQFYALPQSPQQYKQVLMSAGLDRYYQIAKCFRDESLGADRQPEFTQIDVELSFAEMEDVMEVMEGLVKQIFNAVIGWKTDGPFPRITYEQAMRSYGSDKPDVRYGMKICNVSEAVGHVSDDGTVVEAFCVKGGANKISNKAFEKIKEVILTEAFPLLGGKVDPKDLYPIRVSGEAGWTGKLGFGLEVSPAGKQQIEAEMGRVEEGDLVVVNRRLNGYLGPHTIAGRMRLHIIKHLLSTGALSPDNEYNFLWVHSFPLFTPTTHPARIPAGTEATYEATHHPFTAPLLPSPPSTTSPSPTTQHDSLFTSPGDALGQHYDLVVNGQEIGGGSVRVHDPHLQRRIFSEILHMTPERVAADFNHLLDALRFGCPPHAGMAIGFDRMVAILCGASSIRDVIAFPKLSGGDLFVGSPAGVSGQALKEYHLKVVE